MNKVELTRLYHAKGQYAVTLHLAVDVFVREQAKRDERLREQWRRIMRPDPDGTNRARRWIIRGAQPTPPEATAMKWVRTDDRPIDGRQRIPVKRGDEEGLIEIVNGFPRGAVYQEFGTGTLRILDRSPSIGAW